MQLSLIFAAVLASLATASPTRVQALVPRASCNDAAITNPPVAPTPLPAPARGVKNILVAIGKGTQNYTCGSSGSVTPVPIGALATLYDASCLALHDPNGLAKLTHSTKDTPGAPGGLPVIGRHYFADATTPVFVINDVGTTYAKKNASSNAPANDSGDVPWLFLVALPRATTNKVYEIYRENTSGGSAPVSCSGRKPGVFTVNYAANYYFYGY